MLLSTCNLKLVVLNWRLLMKFYIFLFDSSKSSWRRSTATLCVFKLASSSSHFAWSSLLSFSASLSVVFMSSMAIFTSLRDWHKGQWSLLVFREAISFSFSSIFLIASDSVEVFYWSSSLKLLFVRARFLFSLVKVLHCKPRALLFNAPMTADPVSTCWKVIRIIQVDINLPRLHSASHWFPFVPRWFDRYSNSSSIFQWWKLIDTYCLRLACLNLFFRCVCLHVRFLMRVKFN